MDLELTLLMSQTLNLGERPSEYPGKGGCWKVVYILSLDSEWDLLFSEIIQFICFYALSAEELLNTLPIIFTQARIRTEQNN